MIWQNHYLFPHPLTIYRSLFMWKQNCFLAISVASKKQWNSGYKTNEYITAVRYYSPHFSGCLSLTQNSGVGTFYINDFNALWRVILRESIAMLGVIVCSVHWIVLRMSDAICNPCPSDPFPPPPWGLEMWAVHCIYSRVKVLMNEHLGICFE